MTRRFLLLALLAFASPAEAYEFGLQNAGDISVGAGCYDVKTADLNGDGYADVVAALYDAGRVEIVFGTAGGLGSKARSIGGAPDAVDLADFDGNGSIDILAADWNGAVRLILNAGNGTFFLAGVFPVPGNPRDVASGDFNGDGLRDAIVASTNGNVSFLPRLPSGGFGAAVEYAMGYAMKGIAAGDLDNDGDLDAAVIDAYGRTLYALRNVGGLPFPFVNDNPIGFVGSPSDVALADLDSDGFLDVAVSMENGTAATLRGTTVGFQLPVHVYSIGAASQSIQVADVDQEGGPDLVVSNYLNSNVHVLRNRGAFLFNDAVIASCGNAPRSAAAGDVDGDGRIDVVSGDSNVGSVTFLRSIPPFGKLTYSPAALDYGEDYRATGEVLSVQLKNDGLTTLVVTPGPIDDAEFEYDPPVALVSIQPGLTKTLGIRYLRTKVGEVLATAHLATSDTLAPAVTIALSGSAIPAYGQIACASSLDFGTDYVGHEATLPIVFQNTGHATLGVSAGAIDGDEFEYAGATDPVEVPIGGSGSFAIRYKRLVPGPATGTLHLATTDPDAPEVTIDLTGTAGLPPVAEFSAPAPITVSAGTQAQVHVVVRNTGTGPLKVTVPASASDWTETSPLDLGPTSQEFLRFDVSGALWNLDGEGRVVSGANGEYAGGMDESNFVAQSSGILGLGGRELRLGPVLVAPGVLVTRKIYVPGTGGWVRYIDVAENPGDVPRTATFELVDNLGYALAAQLRTSDGDAQFELVDDWVVAPAPADRRTVGRVFRAAGAVHAPVLANWVSSVMSASRTRYVAMLAPHERACVIQWSVQASDANEAVARVEALRQDPLPGLELADAIDRATAWNLAPSPHPFRVNAGESSVAPGDSLLVPVVFGAEAATHDADLSAVLRIATDDPDHRVLEVPLAFSVGNGQVVGVEPVASAAVELAGFRPNPAHVSGTARVAFRLASSEPATLTLYDVRGRTIARQEIEAPAPGPGSVVLTRASLAPGVVWMRLEQGGRTATGKGIVLP